MATTYTYDTNATVSGTSVTFRAAVKASAATAVKNLAIGVRGPNGENLDLADADGGASVTIPVGSWSLIDNETATFTTPGTYTWGLVFQVGNTWYGNLTANTFVIAGASTGGGTTTPPVATPPTTTDGTAAPTGDVTSNGRTWHLAQVEDFTRDATPSTFVATYPNLGHITSGKYRNDLTCTVSGSVLHTHHSHSGSYDLGAWIALLADPSGQGAWAFTGNARLSFRIKSTGSASYGTAAMLSVANNANWTRDGEMDVWEGNAGTSANVNHHYPGHPTTGTTQIPLAATTDYHVVTVEWIGGTSCTYYLDGKVVGTFTGSDVASSTAQFLAVIQTAASDNTDNGAPDSDTADVYIDWIVAWQL